MLYVYCIIKINHLKEGISMNFKELSKKAIIYVTNKALKHNANSTSCLYVYQPKAPKELMRFRKIRNDK